MAKYDPLRDALTRNSGQSVAMSFSEIESLVKGLPPTAFERDEWWANEDVRTTRHVQCKAWGEAGYTASVDRRSRMAIFQRT